MHEENQWPNGMAPMDVKRYYDKNPHLKPFDEQSQHSVKTTGMKPSDIQNLIQATASKKKLNDAASQGEVEE